jgi:transposase
MAQKIRIIDCQNLTFSRSLSQNRMQTALHTLGQSVVQRILCFSLYLLGVNRRAIGQALNLPAETAKSIIKAVGKKGLSALEDRRHRTSTFLPPSPQRPAPMSVHTDQDHIVVDFGIENRRLKIPGKNVLQVRAILLSLLNSGLLKRCQVADLIGLTPAHTATLARRLNNEGLGALIDKRQGQKSDYRITSELKAELVQQFTIDIITRGKTSGEAISSELQKRCCITVPARTVRYHLARMGLPKIKHSLPRLVAAVKKTSKKSLRK